MEEEMNNSFTLKQIADKSNAKITIDIPALQRGLVWKPKQVEFLWDSILRGFPIGGFVLSESRQEDKTENKSENEKNNRKKCDLMDGQQRFDAIRLGFEEPKEIRSSEMESKVSKDSEERIKSILWIDIEPNKNDIKKSTRKYFVKATTIAHPWGYNNDEECSRLSAGERHDALKDFGLSNKNIYNEEIKLTETYPYKSQLPIPLAYIVNSLYELSDCINDKTLDDFILKVFAKCDKSEYQKWKEKFWDSENTDNRTTLEQWLKNNFANLLSLKNYTVPFSLLPKSTIDNEDKLSSNIDHRQINNENATEEPAQSDLEILFQRLNTGGTRISNDDLVYSAIKAYWGDIKERNEEFAKDLIPPQNLIQLIFRLLLTDEKATNFEPPLTIKKIRELSVNKSKKDTITSFYNDYIQTNEIKTKLVNLTDSKKYTEKAIPRYVLMKIIKEKPDVILFSLYLIKNKKLEEEKLIGLILYLYWFSINTSEVINKLYQKCKVINDNTDSLSAIKEGIAELTYEKKIMNIYSPDELELNALKDKYGSNLRNVIDNTAEGKFLYPLMWNPQQKPISKTLLLYAQRIFLNNNFSKFNPADTVAWEDHNCPWDYDHIFPQNKVNLFNQYKDNVKFWLWSIGNFAAIPFTENRSKSDNTEKNAYKYYEERHDALEYDNAFGNIESHDSDEEEKFAVFEKVVFTRMIRLYEKCYKSFEDYVPKLSGPAQKRREIMESLQTKIKEKNNKCVPEFYFVREANDYREYKLTNERDWFRFCVSLKIKVSEKNPDCMISFTWNHMSESLEFGIRRTNSLSEKKDVLNNNNNFTLINSLIKDKKFFGNNIGFEDVWWYRKYLLNIKIDELTNYVDSIADLYVLLYEKLNT